MESPSALRLVYESGCESPFELGFLSVCLKVYALA